MLVAFSAAGEELVLRFAGVLGGNAAADLRLANAGLTSGAYRSVVLDLTTLRRIDAPGADAIAALRNRVQAVGGALVIRNASEQPLAVLKRLDLPIS